MLTRRKRPVLGLLGATAVMATAIGVAIGAVGGSSASAESRAKAAATRAASNNGESNPRNIEWVTTTRGKANESLYQTSIDSDAARDVVVVELRGNFTARFAHRRQGASAPSANFITVIVDSSTGEAIDFSLSPTHMDLSSLGDVHQES